MHHGFHRIFGVHYDIRRQFGGEISSILHVHIVCDIQMKQCNMQNVGGSNFNFLEWDYVYFQTVLPKFIIFFVGGGRVRWGLAGY